MTTEAPADPTTLLATTVDVTGRPGRPGRPVLDPYAAAGAGGLVFVSPDRSLAGWGVAAVLPLPGGLDDAAALSAVRRWLAAVPVDDRRVGAATADGRPGAAGHGPVAFGALPFDRAAPARLVVPRLLYASDGERQWATLVAPAPAGVDDLESALAGLPGPGGTAHPDGVVSHTSLGDGTLPLRTLPEPAQYEKAVAAAIEAIAEGSIDKVVLSRSLDVEVPVDLAVDEALRRLHAQVPSCTAFALPLDPDGAGVFIGASPELLVRRYGTAVRCHPMAGTAALTGEPDRDRDAVARLLGSVKDLREHRLVVDAISDELRPRCSVLTIDDEPSIAYLHTDARLATDIEGTLDGLEPPSALELVAALHPTPAVGGTPRHEAIAMIDRLENGGRGPWAGPVGYVDAAGDGEWVIGIRSATIRPDGTRLCAGAGIVAGSDPANELAETTLKLRPLLQVLYPAAVAPLNGAP